MTASYADQREKADLKRQAAIARSAGAAEASGPSVSLAATSDAIKAVTAHRDDDAAAGAGSDVSDDDEEDDEFLKSYRERRMAQMRSLSAL